MLDSIFAVHFHDNGPCVSLFAQEVHSLIDLVGLDLVKSAVLLARADLIEDVFCVVFGPF